MTLDGDFFASAISVLLPSVSSWVDASRMTFCFEQADDENLGRSNRDKPEEKVVISGAPDSHDCEWEKFAKRTK